MFKTKDIFHKTEINFEHKSVTLLKQLNYKFNAFHSIRNRIYDHLNFYSTMLKKIIMALNGN